MDDIISIVIPTYNEAGNVDPLVSRLDNVRKNGDVRLQITFMDDSPDMSTVNAVEDAITKYSDLDIRCVHRTGGKGLSQAVIDGFKIASSKYVIVMDGDLQHPPEVILDMTQLIDKYYPVQMIVASRYIGDGDDSSFNQFRRFASGTARNLGKKILPGLKDMSDLTSGYFMVNLDYVDVDKLSPIGWKILIETLVRGNIDMIHEVPFSFGDRNSGESKFSSKEQWNFIRHMYKLRRETDINKRPVKVVQH